MSDKSLTENSVVFRRRAETKINANGEIEAQWTFSPTSVSDKVQIIAAPVYTLPVIFVPGIMGTNLMLTQNAGGKQSGEPVWLMDSATGAASAWAKRGAVTRQLRLNPDTTEVYPNGAVPQKLNTIGDAETIRRQRYWGEVGAMSYQSFLVWLENALNGPNRFHDWKEFDGRNFGGQWGALFGFEVLAKKMIDHGTNIRFPVYACGYNWLKSNMESARRLADRINAIIRSNNSNSFTCEQVVLVTHSMGGLVARACSELLNMKPRIAGVVHGVMPTNGAAVAYKRVRSGTEGSAGIVIGPDEATVSAVFANSPGALQLLPNQFYPKGWLKFGVGVDKKFRELASLPKIDPYEEIYKVRGAWWGLMREELINPAEVTYKNRVSPWEKFLENIENAKNFHTHLSQNYHPDTRVIYGDHADKDDGMTWATVRWEERVIVDLKSPSVLVEGFEVVPSKTTTETLFRLRPHTQNGTGKIHVIDSTGRYECRLVISGKDAQGDGTVPAVSGIAPREAGTRQVYRMGGFGHEAVYRDSQMAQQATLHSILAIAKNVKVNI